MFFRSKKGNGKEKEESSQPAAPQAAKSASQRVPLVASASGKASRETGTAKAVSPANKTAAAAESLAPEELKRRAAASKHLSATMGDLVGLMARSPRHRDHKLSDIRWLVVPAIRTGQYSLATAQSRSHGYTAPVAAVLWASVSDEVDKRISSDLSSPIRLAPREWKSGSNLWIVDAIGDNRLVNEMVKRLQTKEWKGKVVKARIVDAQKQVKIRTIEAQPAQNAAASPNH
jgi:hemolysin-activating ACP:hemolysin acyltransferase